MINTSKEFRNEIFNGNRNFIPYIDITLKDGTVLSLTNSEIWENSFRVEDATSSDGTFTVGAAVTGKLTVTINNIYDDFSTYDFDGAEIIAYVGLQLSETLEKLRVGTYTVDDPSYDGTTITLSCLDNMSKFNRPYSESSLKYPAMLGEILRDACECCGVTLLTTTFDNSDYVVSERPNDESLIFGDIVACVSQIACKWAKMDTYGRLKLGWYDMAVFEANTCLDGGTFDTTDTPYSDGDTADGGDFIDYSSGDSVDGGSFTDQDKFHHIYSTKSFSISTDDVVITGVQVTDSSIENAETYLAGDEGYVISISGNVLIQSGQAEEVAEYILGKIGGMRFRPLNISALADPTIEAGDVAYFTDQKCNTYNSFISQRVFNLGGFETVYCDAETPAKNSAKAFSEMTKAIVKARQETKKQITAYDLAVQQLTNLIANSFGVFKTNGICEDGSTIYYLHNKPEIEDSDTIWKMTADGFAVSTNGGETWNAGMDSEGNVILNVLSAIGINADWINAGTITAIEYKNKLGTFRIPRNGGMYLSTVDGKAILSIDGNNIDLYNYKNAGEHVGRLMPVTLTNDQTKAGVALSAEEGMYLSLGMMTSDTTSQSAIRVETGENSDTKTTIFNEFEIQNIPLIGGSASGTMFPNNSSGGIVVNNGLITKWGIRSYTGTLTFVDGFNYTQYANATKINSVHYCKLTVKDGIIESYETYSESI